MWDERLRVELQLLKRSRDMRRLLPIEEDSTPFVKFDNRRLIDFANWDVFDLSSRRDFRKIHQEFSGRGAGRLSLSRGGWTRYHRAAESALASFLGCDDALLLSSRNQAIFSFVLNTLADQDILFVDETLGAAPILDAACVGGIPVVTYRNDYLDQLSRRHVSPVSTGERLFWVQGLHPELGVMAPLAEVERVARERGDRVVVDETFSLGLLGAQCAGVVDLLGLRGVPAAIVGGVGPALGVSGGVIAGSGHLCELIRLRSPAVHKEAPLSVGTAASIPVAIDLLRGLSGETERLQLLRRQLEMGLAELGFDTRSAGGFPIVSIILPPAIEAYRIWEVLLQGGFWCDFDETVLRQSRTSVIRFVISVRHDSDQIKRLLEVMAGVSRGMVASSRGAG